MTKRNLMAVFIVIIAMTGLIGLYNVMPANHVSEPTSGRAVYQRNCAGCHGVDGTGNGPAAEYLFPKPRDFTSGTYKFTSTPNGTLPTDNDIKQVIKQGLSPGGMPGFNNVLNEQQINSVTRYIKQFSNRFEKEKIPDPIQVPEPPKNLVTEKRVERGKQLYDKLGCASCHGPEGKGNGPAADAQKDQWGEPVPPRDLTLGRYKNGQQFEDLYHTIMTGINGTGMPPYDGALSKEADRLAIIAYVRSLATNAGDRTAASGALGVKKVDSSRDVLTDPTAPIWESANRTKQPLYSLWLTDRTPFNAVRVRALHNGEYLALRMSWEDPTHNVRPVGQTEFSDGVAVMFPSLTGAVPFIGMGEQGMEGGVADIWHWRASDQFAVDRGGTTVDMEDKYPYMDVTYYKNKADFEPGSQARYRGANQHSVNQPDTFQTATASGNPLAKQSIKRPVRSYRAQGFGSLTALEEDKMAVDGNGVYRDGRWQVVMIRPLKTNTEVAQFKPGKTYNAAFAVWDGEQGDRNGQKDISTWIPLKLETQPVKQVADTN